MRDRALLAEARHHVTFFLKQVPLFPSSSLLPPLLQPYFSVSPQLVALHAVAVVEGDGAGVGDGVEAELLGVLGVSRPDVLPPGEGEHLCTRTS